MAVLCGTLALAAALLSQAEIRRAAIARPIAAETASARHAAAGSPAGAVAGEKTRVPLFFGYVEFDWDPDEPNGVPGFGPGPPSNPRIYAETTR